MAGTSNRFSPCTLKCVFEGALTAPFGPGSGAERCALATHAGAAGAKE